MTGGAIRHIALLHEKQKPSIVKEKDTIKGGYTLGNPIAVDIDESTLKL